ncbi:hypothetical protein E8E11_003149 [Didymella keratinophila]|nr:hypothetical protein E8E11_003149 [Didymella keratinophila]
MGIMNKEYGMIQKWKSEEAAAQAMANSDAVHPVHSMHILALQAYMYGFLKECIMGIITDKLDELNKISLDFDMTCEGPMLVPHECRHYCHTAGFSSLQDIIRESQYRALTLRDTDRLEALISACKSVAEDHVWMLREDPGYFTEVVNEQKEHRPELPTGSSCGKIHKTGRTDILWARTLRNAVANCYIDLFVWDRIHRDISEVARLSKVHDEHFGRGILFNMSSKLSPMFSQSLIKTWSFLELIQLNLIQQLKFGWPASLELRALFAQECGPGEGDVVLGVKLTGGRNCKRDKELEHIFDLFRYLWEPSVRQSLRVFNTLVDAI